MKPSIAFNRFSCFIDVVPVTEHRVVSAAAYFPRSVDWNNFSSFWIDYFDLIRVKIFYHKKIDLFELKKRVTERKSNRKIDLVGEAL